MAALADGHDPSVTRFIVLLRPMGIHCGVCLLLNGIVAMKS